MCVVCVLCGCVGVLVRVWGCTCEGAYGYVCRYVLCEGVVKVWGICVRVCVLGDVVCITLCRRSCIWS